MGVIEDLRQVLQDFLAPELREIHGQFSSVQEQFSSIRSRLDAMEEVSRIRHESTNQRLDQILQYFAFDKRLSDLEAEKRRSA